MILDVVYNHVGPDGNYLPELAKQFFSRTHTTDWGDAQSFDEAGSEQVRAFFLANVPHWIGEYHLDGVRVDVTQDVHDASEPHILVDGAVLATGCFALRYVMDEPAGDRLLIVNLARDRELVGAPEPLPAPPAGRAWRLDWSSEDPRYGGRGTPEPETEEGWRIPGPAAVVLAPRTEAIA